MCLPLEAECGALAGIMGGVLAWMVLMISAYPDIRIGRVIPTSVLSELRVRSRCKLRCWLCVVLDNVGAVADGWWHGGFVEARYLSVGAGGFVGWVEGGV
jgi:hypothetical protein